MKKFLAAAAVLAPMVALLPAAPASADSVCAPITIDDQPVCQDTTPIEQTIANAEAQVLAVLAPVNAIGTSASVTQQCISGTLDPTASRINVDVVVGASNGTLVCTGTEIAVEPPLSSSGALEHVHVPKICATPTGTCAGPIDQDVQLPVGPGASLTVCETPVTIAWDGFSWRRQYTGPSNCFSVPLA